jgi:uncharacterized protein (TIGR03437 family)
MVGAVTPPGGTVQLQVFLDTPQKLVSGGASITLDPTIFDNIQAVDVYSATGDQIGTSTISGRSVNVQFKSLAGGVGASPGLPLLTITVPVLAAAVPGAQFSLTLNSDATRFETTPWMDANGLQYSVTVSSGLFTVGNGLSVSNVRISGGLQAAGSVVEVDGAGFTNETTLSIDGVAIAETQFISPQKLNVVLGANAILDFRRFEVQNPGEAPVTFFAVLHQSYSYYPTIISAYVGVQPIFPLQLFQVGYVGTGNLMPIFPELFAIQNISSSQVNVNFRFQGYNFGQVQNYGPTVAIPPGENYGNGLVDLGFDVARNTQLYVTPSAPVRMALSGSMLFDHVGTSLPPPNPLASNPRSLTFNMTAGAALPPPQSFTITAPNFDSTFRVTTSTASNGSWLSASPASGIVCTPPGSQQCEPNSRVAATVTQAGLSPGTYQGWITVTPQDSGSMPVVIPVVLNVFAAPMIFADRTAFAFPYSGGSLISESFDVSSSADPVTFAVAVTTLSGKKWLSATPNQFQTPAYVVISGDGSALGGQSDTGVITLAGPDNLIQIPISYNVNPPPVFPSYRSLYFSAIQGTNAALQEIYFSSNGVPLPFSLSLSTSDGSNWLTLATGAPLPKQTPFTAFLAANPSNLEPGTYSGTVTVTAPPESTNTTNVPVTFLVTPAPPAKYSGTLPLITATVNAASQLVGSVASGEAVAIFGQSFPPSPQVMFDGIAATVLYASPTQVNAIVPSGIATHAATNISVGGIAAGAYPVVSATPGVFTINSTGVGQASVLNQDGTVNSVSNPAARGSSIQIFATGAGDADLSSATFTIGGANAPVSQASAMAGVLRLSAVVPQDAALGPVVPVVLTVSSAASQPNVTIAVK